MRRTNQTCLVSTTRYEPIILHYITTYSYVNKHFAQMQRRHIIKNITVLKSCTTAIFMCTNKDLINIHSYLSS